MFRRLASLIRKEFIQIARDPRTLGITFVMPVMMLILLGYSATNDVRNIRLVVLDQDQTPASRALIEAYRVADYFRLDRIARTEDEIRTLIDNNSAGVGLIIPPGYGRKVAGWQQAQVAFVLDGSDPTMASTALAAATMIGQAHSTDFMVERLEQRGMGQVVSSPIEVRTTVWYNPGMVSANFMVPAMIGIILQFLTTLLTATSGCCCCSRRSSW